MIYLLILWTTLIFIATCTASVHDLANHLQISFHFTPNPNWGEFMKLQPIDTISEVEFIGHFFMFFILTVLLRAITSDNGIVVLLALTYGLLTEILQMYFHRGSEFYDMVANMIGIGVAIFLILWQSRWVHERA